MAVFILVASLSLIVLPATRADADTGIYYLKGTGVPKADLSTAAPTSGSLPNYDPDEDSEPGRTLDKSDQGWNESDSGKYQLWVAPKGEMAISGQVTLTFWSAMKDFEDDKGGRVEAFLLDCNPGGNNCVLIGQGSRQATPWTTSGSWVSNTIDFGSVTYSITSNRSLAIKVVVGDESDDDMWFAYDTTAYPSSLSLQTVAPTTTTTTTAAPTTTIPAATPPPPGPTTAVAPIVGTTSTTTPTSDGSSTTLASSTRPGGGAGPTDGPAPVEAGEGAGIADADMLFDLSFGNVEDPVLATMGLDASVALTRASSWTGSVIKGLELVIPPWAAAIVASPLMILGFVLEAMTDSGKAIMLPVALLMVGMLWVVFESRGFAFAFLGRPKDNDGAS
ncbi:MAG: hypothetical protein M3P87_06470 [Actinomycetota bacterium]|nr:hypothetical protein [Actinomycetota bacterium]